MRILIVEDEFNLADVVASRLRKEKYSVDISTNGEDGLDNALTNIYDLIILDVMLPKLNGFEEGANDYVTKPFHIEELVARVNVWLRSSNPSMKKDYIEAGDLKLNKSNSNLECTSTNEKIDIILKEFLLLEYLMQNPNQILSREQIYEKVWGMDSEAESNNLEAYLSFIRRKLKAIGSKANIKAIRGVGYRLET